MARHPLCREKVKHRLINVIREFARGKTRSEYDKAVGSLHRWAATLVGTDGGQPDSYTMSIFESVEIEVFNEPYKPITERSLKRYRIRKGRYANRGGFVKYEVILMLVAAACFFAIAYWVPVIP